MDIEKFKVIPKENINVLYFEPIEEDTSTKLNQLYSLLEKENSVAVVDYDGDRILAFIPSRPEIIKYYGLNFDYDEKKHIAVLIHLTDADIPLNSSDDVYYSSDLTETNPKSAVISLIANLPLNTQQLLEILKTLRHPERFPSKDTGDDFAFIKELLGQNKIKQEFEAKQNIKETLIKEEENTLPLNDQEFKLDSYNTDITETFKPVQNIEIKQEFTKKRLINPILTSNSLNNGVALKRKSTPPRDSTNSRRSPSHYSQDSWDNPRKRKRELGSIQNEIPTKKRNYSLEHLEQPSDQSKWNSSSQSSKRNDYDYRMNGSSSSPKRSQKDSSGKRVVHKNLDSDFPTQTLWIGFGYSKTPVDFNTLKKDFDLPSLDTVNFLQHQKCAFVNYKNIEDAIAAKKNWEGTSKYPQICFKVYSAKYPTDNDGKGNHPKKPTRY